ncbi:MAG: PAS domain-containing protein [Anaerolineae bacterium]|nr:PAS domain-containing protein [Anaerolineae bacterium]MCB9108562.1 PAS domain-containing protein [Anaerolineales bacterium]
MNGQIKTDAQVQEELASLRCRVDELDRANRQLRQEIAEQQETMSDLRRRESLWRALLKDLPIDFWARDLNERLIIESDVKTEVWGNLMNKTLDEITHLDPATVEHWRQNNKRVLTGETITEEMEMTTPCGEWKFLRKIAAPIYVEGELQGIMGVNIDLTERQRAEKALKESEARFKSLYAMVRLMCDNVPDMVWAKDLDEKFIFANRATCQKLLSATDTDEPIGQTHQFFADRERNAHPDQPAWHTFDEICITSDEIVMKTQCPQRFDEFGYAEGKFLYLDVYKAPFWNELGEMIGTVGCGRIVTQEKEREAERQRTEVELQEIRKRYELATSAGQVWVWDWSMDNKLFNSSLIADLGYDRQDIQNELDFWDQIIHPDDQPFIETAITNHLHGMTDQFEYEYRMRPKNGDYRWFLTRGNAIRDDDDRPIRLMGVTTDITKQKQARQQLQASLQEKEVLLREVHHRVKNNLQLISSLFDLQIDCLANDQVVKILEECQSRIQAMALVHQTLYYSEYLSRINSSDYLHNLVNQLHAVYVGRLNNISLNLDIQDLSFQIDTALYCGLIISELVSNALKHAFPDNQPGRIQIQLRAEKKQVTLIVADNGIGFTADLDRIHPESLGLLLVDTFVKQLEGALVQLPGKGAIFQISFPNSIEPEQIL